MMDDPLKLACSLFGRRRVSVVSDQFRVLREDPLVNPVPVQTSPQIGQGCLPSRRAAVVVLFIPSSDRKQLVDCLAPCLIVLRELVVAVVLK